MRSQKIDYLRKILRLNNNNLSIPQLKKILQFEKSGFEHLLPVWKKRFGIDLILSQFLQFDPSTLPEFFYYLLKELKDEDIEVEPKTFELPLLWSVPNIVILEQGEEKPNNGRTTINQISYEYIIKGYSLHAEFDTNSIKGAIEVRVFNLYDDIMSKKFAGWQREPQFAVNHKIDTTATSYFVFSSGGEQHGTVTENLFVWIEWDAQMKIISRFGRNYVFNPQYMTLCESFFRDMIENKIPELLFALVTYKIPNLNAIINEIKDIIERKNFSELDEYKSLFQKHPIVYKLLRANETPYRNDYMDAYFKNLLNLSHPSAVWGMFDDEKFILLTETSKLRFDGFYISYGKTTLFDEKIKELDSAHILIFRPNNTVISINLVNFHKFSLNKFLPQIKNKYVNVRQNPKEWTGVFNEFRKRARIPGALGQYTIKNHNSLRLRFELSDFFVSIDSHDVLEYTVKVINEALVGEKNKYKFISLIRE